MQPDFVDIDSRHQELEKLGDPLPKLAELVDWEGFRPLLELDQMRKKERKNASGRKSYDVVLVIKILFLQSFYGLGDDQTEYQIPVSYTHLTLPTTVSV